LERSKNMAVIVRRKPLLSPEEEEELKREMRKYRKLGLPWSEIAKLLEFGVEGSKWEKLKPEYIYHYRRKFGFPLDEEYKDRPRYPHRYKYGKQQEPISASEFFRRIEALPKLTFHQRRKRAFNILAFYTGLRSGEIRMLRKRDIKVEGDTVTIYAFREKKGRTTPLEEKVKPVILNRRWKLVPEFLEYIEQFEDEEQIFPISRTTAWKYVKDLFPKGYPHYYRLNRITDLCNTTNMTLVEIRNWTALHLTTIERYISRSERYVRSVADKLKFPTE